MIDIKFLAMLITSCLMVISVIGLAYAVELGDEGGDGLDLGLEDILLATENATYANNSNSSDYWDNLDTPFDIDLGDLGDVFTSGVADEDILMYNGTDWLDYDLFDTSNPYWTAQNVFNDLVINQEEVITFAGIVSDTFLEAQLIIGDATIDLPKSTTTISGNSVADQLPSADQWTATPVSFYMAECIEHSGDRDNQICFPSNDEQKFQLTGGADYLTADRNGGKTNVHWNVYGVDWEIGSGDFLIKSGELRFLGNADFTWPGIKSITTEATSTASTYVNVFDEDSYASYDYTNNTDDNDADAITYTPTNGEFLISWAGTYTIDLSLIIQGSGADEYAFNLSTNNVSFYDHDFFIHSSVDPVMRTLSIMQDFSANDTFKVEVYGTDGVDTAILLDGTTLNIERIR